MFKYICAVLLILLMNNTLLVAQSEFTLDICTFNSLRATINHVSRERGEHEININCDGTLVFTDEIFILGPISLTLHTNNAVIFDGDGESRFFRVQGKLTLDGIVLQNGYAAYGGAIRNENSLTLFNTQFLANVGEYGGAIFNEGALNIFDSTFADNEGRYEGGAIRNVGSLNITNTIFRANEATIGGGAIDNIEGNLLITTSQFLNNTAFFEGGAIRTAEAILITHSLLDGNVADTGGAIHNSGELILRNNTFSHNSAALGGMLYNHADLETEATLSNNIAFDNQATKEGGVLYHYAGYIQLKHNTFVNNTAPEGSAFFSFNRDSILLTHNVIVADSPQCDATIRADATNMTLVACDEAQVVDDMRLGDDETGFTPLPDSPLLDVYPAPCEVTIDRYNTPRPQGAGCDAGAVEMP